MKKIIALLAVFVLFFNLSFTQPVRADTFSIPFSAVPDLINAFYTIAAGGKIEFSALIGDMTGIDDFWQNLQDYYDTHYTQPLLQSTQGLVDIGLSGLALDGISSIDTINNLSIPITPQDIANFMGYDVNWVDRYNDVEEIIVNPDHTYDAYLNTINEKTHDYNKFWFYNYPNSYVYSSYTVNMTSYPFDSFSWVARSDINNNTFGGTYSPYMFSCPILTINITSNNGVYSYSISGTGNSDVCHIIYSNPYQYVNYNNIRLQFDNSSVIDGYGGNSQNGFSFTYSYSNSDLGLVLNDVSRHFKNVNIVVDGNIWSYVGDVQNPGISLNDYTQVGNTDNITYGVFPLTSTGDIGLDLAKWGEYIYNQCISGDGTLTMDTVIDDGWTIVDTEDGERAITQDDEEDVAKVIHGFVGTTATTPTPTPDIGDPPVLKIIPPILELPDEIWPDGGRDTTVLAQIIHSTDVILPNDIMTILWSILGILVIGGLLTILHK